MKKTYILLVLIIFLTNLIWESGQAFLYQPHFQGRLDFFLVHSRASIGDVFIFVLIYLIGVVFFANKNWIFEKNKLSYLFAVISGMIIGVVIEKIALNSERWSYNDIMPIIPIVNVGLTPVLQMILLPSIMLFIAKNKP